jgi:hypothetical protein
MRACCYVINYYLLRAKLTIHSIYTLYVKRAQNAIFFVSIQSHNVYIEIAALISIIFSILILKFKLLNKFNFDPIVQFMRT